MLLSRFWYVLLGLVLGAAMFVLFIAMSMYNRAGAKAMGEALQSDSQVVYWYLRDDARERSAQLIKFALNPDVAKYLAKSTDAEGKVPTEAQDKIKAALQSVNESIPKEQRFDAVFAVDQHGRVVAFLGYPQALGMENFELGGYPVVADALRGYVRDDSLVLDRVYRIAARPVQQQAGAQPAGAIVGGRIIDQAFARALSKRTGAAVAFYARGQRVAAAAPEGFVESDLDQIVGDLKNVKDDPDYVEKGRSQVRTIHGLLGVVYAKLPGETWDLGAGYAVGRLRSSVSTPLGFFSQADDKDKQEANLPLAVGVALAAALLGLIFSLLEHTRPISVFRAEAIKLGKGEVDQLLPSKFRGVFRKIASDVNDGIDQALLKGGTPRKGAADLKQVLGDLPDEPQMSAFSFPGDAAPPSSPSGVEISSPGLSGPASSPGGSSPGLSSPGLSSPNAADTGGGPRPPPRPPPAPAAVAAVKKSGAPGPTGGEDQLPAEWQQIYEEFVSTKEQCGENVEGFTFQKFSQTLKKNRDALIKRHGAKRVKFSVYVKDGKAALKASPIKE